MTAGVGPITRMTRSIGGHILLMYGPHHRGCLLQLEDGRWTIADVNERRLSKKSFRHASMARDEFDHLYPDGVPA